jgi:hypothetical protein
VEGEAAPNGGGGGAPARFTEGSGELPTSGSAKTSSPLLLVFVRARWGIAAERGGGFVKVSRGGGRVSL